MSQPVKSMKSIRNAQESEEMYNHVGIQERLRERVLKRLKMKAYCLQKADIEVEMERAKKLAKKSAKGAQLAEKIKSIDESGMKKVEQLKGLVDNISPDDLEDFELDFDGGATFDPLEDLRALEKPKSSCLCMILCCPCKCCSCCCRYSICLGPCIACRLLFCPCRILQKFKKTNSRVSDIPPDAGCCDRCERSRILLDDCAFWRSTQTKPLFQPTTNMPNHTKGRYAAIAREFEYPMLTAPCSNQFCYENVPNCFNCLDCINYASPLWFWGAFIPVTTCRTHHNLRKKAIDYEMNKYICFQGYSPVPKTFQPIIDYFKCETDYPETALCLETCCCLPCSASATRYYVMDKYVLKNSPCDNRVIRCNNFLLVSACFCKVLGKEFQYTVYNVNKVVGKTMDPSGYDFNAFKAIGDFCTVLAILFNQIMLGCAAAQVAHEIDVMEGKGLDTSRLTVNPMKQVEMTSLQGSDAPPRNSRKAEESVKKVFKFADKFAKSVDYVEGALNDTGLTSDVSPDGDDDKGDDDRYEGQKREKGSKHGKGLISKFERGAKLVDETQKLIDLSKTGGDDDNGVNDDSGDVDDNDG